MSTFDFASSRPSLQPSLQQLIRDSELRASELDALLDDGDLHLLALELDALWGRRSWSEAPLSVPGKELGTNAGRPVAA